ncbi:hypothetical protein B0J11DRAFT_595365 [Dendryphion nanum]|uniref:Alpha-L-rhamnosidase six-hairpin glycosidase domain-containing protein n=1 Tax=Dendryphion nanum TaxID=256645 RepID=A0A9P9D7R0_9PLEO|nr:hypothetical protein B0J11DRAFT_595365 [Dendryphion nanum]
MTCSGHYKVLHIMMSTLIRHLGIASKPNPIIAENNPLIGTEFAGIQVIGYALSSIKAMPDPYKMPLQSKIPSWLFQVVMSGTIIWGPWEHLLSNDVVNCGSMTSFDHFAFGSVVDWIH